VGREQEEPDRLLKEESMRLTFATHGPLTALLAGAGLLALTVAPAAAQTRLALDHDGAACPPAVCPPLAAPQPAPMPAPGPAPAAPPITDLALGERSAALGGETVALSSGVGYIDTAIPATRLRLRYDAGFRDTRPDRADFFYPKCGCFADLFSAHFDPRAPGPAQKPDKVDFQETALCFEVASDHRLSAFIEIPVRYVDFDEREDHREELHSNLAGLSDINFGGKYAIVAENDRFLTLQLRTYVPTGDSHKGLGTNHVSLEPALLCYHRISDRLFLEGEFRDWIPIGGTDFAGNVLRYGIGLDYAAYKTQCLLVMPVVEFVGWTVLNGKELDLHQGRLEAGGDEIVNVKGGVRTFFGDHSDVYVGYGRALTGQFWYKDIVRVEYRLTF
jgi:hypothetical protein